MSPLKTWFGSDGSRFQALWNGKLEKQLSAIEAEMDSPSLTFRSRPLNRAGDLCAKARDTERALKYYGRALDALLEDGDLKAARAVATKMIRVCPEAVRTLCTLTWLDLAACHFTSAQRHLDEYVAAVHRAGSSELAVSQVLLMARWSTDPSFLVSAAAALEELGENDWGRAVREWASEPFSPEALTSPNELTTHCLRAAIASNTQPPLPEGAH